MVDLALGPAHGLGDGGRLARGGGGLGDGGGRAPHAVGLVVDVQQELAPEVLPAPAVTAAAVDVDEGLLKVLLLLALATTLCKIFTLRDSRFF